MSDNELAQLHKRSSRHRDEILVSETCGCFYCLRTFPPTVLKPDDWVDAGATARCPYCGIDAVLGSGSQIAITAELLGRMHEHWFG